MASRNNKENSHNPTSTPHLFNDFSTTSEGSKLIPNAINLLLLRSFYQNLCSNLQGLLYLNSLTTEQRQLLHTFKLCQSQAPNLSDRNSTVVNNFYLNGNVNIQPLMVNPELALNNNLLNLKKSSQTICGQTTEITNEGHDILSNESSYSEKFNISSVDSFKLCNVTDNINKGRQNLNFSILY